MIRKSPHNCKFYFQHETEKEKKKAEEEKPFSIQLQDRLFVFRILLSQQLIPGNRLMKQKFKVFLLQQMGIANTQTTCL